MQYTADAPYTVGLVELEEGLRVTTRLAGPLEQLTAGCAVTLAEVAAAHGPVFRPA
jgi:hypothetical protein